MWDSRSPSVDFERTPPVFDRTTNVEKHDHDIGSVAMDPRSRLTLRLSIGGKLK